MAIRLEISRTPRPDPSSRRLAAPSPRLSTQTCQEYVTEKKGARRQFLKVSQFPSPNGRPSPQLSNGKLRRKSAMVPMTGPARGAQAARPGTLHAASDSRGHNGSQGCFKQKSSGHERASPPGRSGGGGMACGGRRPRPARDVVVVRAGQCGMETSAGVVELLHGCMVACG